MSTVQNQSHKKHTTLEKGSSSRSANIVCHRCKGMGHIMKDCSSTRAFIAAPDGNGYVSASDVEDDLVLTANIVANSERKMRVRQLILWLQWRIFLVFLCSVC